MNNQYLAVARPQAILRTPSAPKRNIAVSSYVEQEDTREVVNITELNQEIAQIVSKQNELRISIDAIVADIEGA